MATDGVGASVLSLRDLFQSHRYLIDVYQREYAWTADDVRVLLNDLWDAFDSYERGGRRAKEQIFLGPFVYVESQRRSRYLVDGQQRFTTLHLIFLHLERIADDFDARRVSGKLHSAVYEFFEDGRPTRYRLDIPERREALEALRDRRHFDVRGKSLSVSNLWARGKQLQELLDERVTTDNFASFVDWLLTQVVMAAIRAPNRASGYRIFESMNDRGARLTPVDLLKSFLLREVGSQELEEELNERWRQMLARLTAAGRDRDTPTAFLKAALLAHWARAGAPARQDAEGIDLALHLWVKQHRDLVGLRTGADYLAFIDKLIKLAGHFATLLRAAGKPDEEFGLAAVYYNHVNGLRSQMPLLLAALDHNDQTSEARPKAAAVANLLDLLYVDRIIADESTEPRTLQPTIDGLIPTLRKCRDLDDVTAALVDSLPSRDPFAAVPTLGMRGNNERQIKYLLARLTTFVERGCGRDVPLAEFLGDGRQWQIEHVFANHPERYEREVPDPATFRALRARVGVLLLLPSSDNASYNDLAFGDKIAYYSRQNQLAAILAPASRQRNPRLRAFTKKYELEPLLHDYGSSPQLVAVVEGRGRLYGELCRCVWSSQELGLPLPWRRTTANFGASATRTGVQSTGDVFAGEGPIPRRRGGVTQLSQLIEAGVIAVDAPLRAQDGDRMYTAVVNDGRIELPTGDSYRLPDEAAAVVRGKKNVSGMSFWLAERRPGEWISLRQVFDQAKRQGRIRTKRGRPR